MARDPEENPTFQPARKWAFGFDTVVAIAALLAIVVMANYLASRHYWRRFWTSETRYQLSPMTKGMLQSVTNQVNVTVLYDPQDAVYGAVTGLLNEYHNFNQNIVIERVDRIRNPAATQVILDKYKENSLSARDMVIFSCGSRYKVRYGRELSEYDIDANRALSIAYAGGTNEFKRKSFRGEMLFTSDIFSVTDPRVDKAYFLQGHREHNLTDAGSKLSYEAFADLLAARSVKVQSLSLLETNAIPGDCRLLVIAGPIDPLEQREVDMIDQYLDHGGRLLLLFCFQPLQYSRNEPQNHLGKLMAKWGVQVGNNVVSDKDNTLTQKDIKAREFGSHPIVKPLLNSIVYLLLPRSVGKLNNGPQSADTAQVTELIYTGPNGVTQSDFSTGVPRPNLAVDKAGKIPLAVAVEKGAIQGISDSRGATRMVVVGDSFFLSGRPKDEQCTLDSAANRDFASMAVNWL
ncbi:MAG TPA: GldG family protein, partial [Verrucomicrobiae bacterium]|nr:GldG family protein [Verrucomicrobiae bacterium]